MTALGCPYAAGPACRDCDGGCWEPEPQQPEREPCQGCSEIAGALTDCEGRCAAVDHCGPGCPFLGCATCRFQPEEAK